MSVTTVPIRGMPDKNGHRLLETNPEAYIAAKNSGALVEQTCKGRPLLAQDIANDYRVQGLRFRV